MSALHGAGPTVPDTRQTAAALGQVVEFNGIELFGTTETGAIAHRQIPSRTDGASTWTLLRDVELVGPRSGEGPLAIRGPRIARPRGDRQPAQLVELDDLVVRDGDRSFTYLGRCSRLIKVNGVRVWLDELEAVCVLRFLRSTSFVSPRTTTFAASTSRSTTQSMKTRTRPQPRYAASCANDTWNRRRSTRSVAYPAYRERPPGKFV